MEMDYTYEKLIENSDGLEFKWDEQGLYVEVRINDDGTERCLELWMWSNEDEDVDYVFDEDSFLSGDIIDFIKNKGKGYEIYSYTPRGGITAYYLRKKDCENVD